MIQRKMGTLIWIQLVNFFTVGIIIFAINLPILHSFEPTYISQMSAITSEGKLLAKSINNESKKLFLDFKNNKITKDQFIAKYDINKINSLKKKKTFKAIRQQKRNSISYRGYKNKRQYKFWLGIIFFTLIISLRYMSKVIRSNPTTFEKIEVFLFSSMSLFMFTWAYKNFNDYSNTHYIITMLVIDCIAILFIYLFFKYYNSIENKLQKIVNIFSRLAIITAPEYMNTEQKQKFKRRYINELEKGAES